MYFDGIDDYVALFSTNLPDFTLVAWARLATPSWPSPAWRAIISKGWVYASAGVGGIYVSPYGVCGGLLRDSAGNVHIITVILMPSLLHSFRCIALTSEARLYVDGELSRSEFIANPVNTNTYPWNIGRDPIGSARVFPGYIAQVLFYSRVLSSDEIRWNYQYPDNPVRNGLVLWLKADPSYVKDIDGDRILEWIDLSGFNNHGKIYGASLVELVKTAKRVLTPVRIQTPAR
jgi:hypothetical protein